MMLRLKKILCVVIALSMILTVPSLVYAEETTNKTSNTHYKNEINELKAIGIVDYDLQPETLITRGEFAHLLVRFLGVNEESLNESVQLFYDVPIAHKDFQVISYCARQGYMIGYGNNIFQPDKKLVAEEVFKPIVSALGYDYKAANYGGNAAAYMQVAKELGMLKGIDLPYGENLFHEEVAKLLHNLLNTPVVLKTGVSEGEFLYEVDKNRTILSEYHKMQRLTGKLLATDIAGIKGYSAMKDGECVIDGATFFFTDPMVRRFLGHKVDALYSIDDTSLNTIITCQSADDMNKITVLNEDVAIFKAGSFIYLDEYEKTRTLKVAPDFEFFYNGKNQRYDEALIKDASYGYFELLSSESNSDYDLVMFYDFKTFVVDRISLDREIIQSASALDGVLNFDSTVYKNVFVDSYGDPIDIKDLRQNDVITYTQYKDYLYAIVSRGVVSGAVTELNTSESAFSIDSVSYKFSGDKAEIYTSVKVNFKVSGYIDCFGNIAGINIDQTNKLANIYLPVKFYKQTVAGETDAGLKVYSFENQKLQQILIDDVVKLNGSPLNTLDNYTALETAVFADGKNHPVILKINSKGLITTIETARVAAEYGEFEDGLTTMIDNVNLIHYNSIAAYRSDAYTNPSTRGFVIPNDIVNAKEEDFKALNALPRDNLSRYVSVYTDSKDNRYATLALYKESEYYKFPSKLVTGVITKVTEVVNEEGDVCKKIYVRCDGVDDFFIVDDSEFLDQWTSTTTTAPYYKPSIKAGELSVGDYISYVKDENGNLALFNCFWKANENYLKSCYQLFTSSNRVIKSEVLAIDSEFIKIKSDLLTAGTSSTVYGKIESLKHDGLNSVTIIEGNGTPNVRVYDASFEDIMLEDEIVIHSISFIMKRIFVIR